MSIFFASPFRIPNSESDLCIYYVAPLQTGRVGRGSYWPRRRRGEGLAGGSGSAAVLKLFNYPHQRNAMCTREPPKRVANSEGREGAGSAKGVWRDFVVLGADFVQQTQMKVTRTWHEFVNCLFIL